MLLKSLELHGFKSFPDRTKLEFGKGITAIVGPNGSGKSNISDAVRWVLGEQSSKTLRGTKMEDVIFGGTQTRNAQGVAEVSLTIDNSERLFALDSDVVTITRKYYRSAESEYLLNGAAVRLKDINELLMDTGLGRDGYSIVGQGRIAEIVGAKSNERREIFEEAAGISKYRYRKEESERRLEAAEENLLRLYDIVKELEDRVGPLKSQSEKASRFLEYASEKKELELSYWVHLLGQLTNRLREQDDKLTIANSDCDEIDRQIDESEARLQEVYRLMQGFMTLSEELRRKKQQLEQNHASFASQVAVIENDIAHNLENIERIRLEIGTLTQSSQQIDGDIEKRLRMIGSREEQISTIEEEIARAQENLTAASEQTDEYQTKSQELRDKINTLIVQKTENTLKIDVIRSKIEELKQSMKANEESLSQQQDKLSAAKSEHDRVGSDLTACSNELESCRNTIEGYILKLKNRRSKLDSVNKELFDAEAQLQSKMQRMNLLRDLEKNMEGFSGSVKAVLNAQASGRLRGILGSVAQLISVESKYSIAIEIALGSAMQNVVVDREDSAKLAVNFLKEQKSGRATFLPLTSVKATPLSEPSLMNEDGYIALGSELVSYDKTYDGVICWLLGRTVVTENIDHAIRIAQKYRYRFRIVTLDGQVVNAGGSITGGFAARSQGILSRKNDIANLKAEAERISSQIGSVKLGRDELVKETAKLEAQVEAAQSMITAQNENKIRLEGESKRLEHVVSDLNQQITLLQEGVATHTKQIDENSVLMKECQNILSLSESELLHMTDALKELEGSNAELLERLNRFSADMSSYQVQKAEAAKEIESLREFIADLRSRKDNSAAAADNFTVQIGELEKRNEELATQISVLKENAEKCHTEAEDLDHQVANALAQREQNEGKTNRIREEQRALSDRKEGIIRETAHLEEQKIATQKEYDGIINQMWNEYEITRSQADAVAKPVEDFKELQMHLAEIKSKIKSLGNVNLSAIEEYKEVKERFEYLTGQISDVEYSKNELIRLIGDLTENMKEIFIENFEKINRNFSQIFSDLFEGGKGELVLEDPDNILESGIEINVQPPGKVIKNLSALSGGEQAFVAIAIYFAILKVRPAPFCILDEIEAALDDVNVDKYARYLRSFSDNTQFILITHRRGTMEEADVLYGVTMQQEGVSKLIELNVSEVAHQMSRLVR